MPASRDDEVTSLVRETRALFMSQEDEKKIAVIKKILSGTKAESEKMQKKVSTIVKGTSCLLAGPSRRLGRGRDSGTAALTETASWRAGGAGATHAERLHAMDEQKQITTDNIKFMEKDSQYV